MEQNFDDGKFLCTGVLSLLFVDLPHTQPMYVFNFRVYVLCKQPIFPIYPEQLGILYG